MRPRHLHQHHNNNKLQRQRIVGLPPTIVIAVLSFLLGSIVSASLLLLHLQLPTSDVTTRTVGNAVPSHPRISAQSSSSSNINTTTAAVLENLRILVVLVAFDFSQLPHLEEVLDAYHDAAVAGATVDVHIHATVAYPVTLIDMWNDRFADAKFQVTIVLKPKSLRLHLVDCHRQTFYDNLQKYDLFVYSEDDIRVSPTVIASYVLETRNIERLLEQRQQQQQQQYKPSDFNVGIVRYEYDYPSNVIIDDKTRHATQNVTRVYWEHSGFDRPDIVPNAVKQVDQPPLSRDYVTMKNHHQGMYLATRALLQEWKERCQFDIATNRPGKGSQPTEGTQRVWMSSQMLYGGRHCNVQQVLPKDRFGTLTTLHLPNKNYRRVGKYRSRQFSDGTEVFEKPHASLLKAMELHLALKRAFSPPVSSSSSSSRSNSNQKPYRGCVRMVNEVDRVRDATKVLERRMKAYHAYVARGGILSESDYARTDLVESEEESAVGTDDV
mmetsp:Transcript_28629/g.78638  ORF Transcript_28629/g.78638 Transcript_28629/m.78638 type:complete len:495 (+) Transcript_28629:356-1840(+)